MTIDASGRYTLPNGYFVSGGDVVLPAQHNPPLQDIEAALNFASLRDGRATMTGLQELFGDGVLPMHGVTRRQLDAVKFMFDTRAEASSSTISASIDVIYIAGHTTAGSGGAFYKRVPDVSALELWQFRSNSATVRWQLTPTNDGVVNVKTFGAVGDGVNDDTAAIQAAINFANTLTVSILPTITGFISASVYYPRGNYSHSGLLNSKPLRHFGDGNQSTFMKLRNGSNKSLFQDVLPGTVAGPAPWYYQRSIYEDMTIDVNKDNQTGVCHGIEFTSTAWPTSSAYCFGGYVNRMEIWNAKGDGIYIGQNRNNGFIDHVNVSYVQDNAVQNFSFDWHAVALQTSGNVYGWNQPTGGGTHISNSALFGASGASILIGSGTLAYFIVENTDIGGSQQNGVIVDGGNDQRNRWVTFSQCRFAGNSQQTDAFYADILALNHHGLAVVNCQFMKAGVTFIPNYLLSTTNCGPVIWQGNHYLDSSSDVPFATAITNDFSKLVVAGDRQANILRTSDGKIRIPKLKGTNTNDNAGVGEIGEVLAASATAVSMTTSVVKNITSITLTAGDWDVSGALHSIPSGATQTNVRTSISSTSATHDFVRMSEIATTALLRQPIPVSRFSLSSTTIVYLVADCVFGGAGLTTNGYIQARRVR
jgi:Pectate lyase superfamily protein